VSPPGKQSPFDTPREMLYTINRPSENQSIM
jgi:hypothetical protein